MATVQEARTQLEQAKRTLQQREQQIREYQVTDVRPAAVLRKQTKASQEQFRNVTLPAQQAEFEKQKPALLLEIEKIKKESIEPYEKEVIAAEISEAERMRAIMYEKEQRQKLATRALEESERRSSAVVPGLEKLGKVTEYQDDIPIKTEFWEKGIKIGTYVYPQPKEEIRSINIPAEKLASPIISPSVIDVAKDYRIQKKVEPEQYGQRVSRMYEPNLVEEKKGIVESYVEPYVFRPIEKGFQKIGGLFGPGRIPVPTKEGVASIGLPILYIGEKLNIKKEGRDFSRETKEKLATALYGKQLIVESNLPQAAAKGFEALEYSGEVLAGFQTEFLTTTSPGKFISKLPVGVGIPGTPLYKGTILGTALPYAVRNAPTVAVYSIAPFTAATAGILAGTEKLKQLDITAEKEARKQYKSMVMTPPPEGYKWETETEYLTKATPEIRAGMKRQILIEGAINVGVIGVGVAAKGYQFATKPLLVGYRSPIIKGSAMKGIKEVQYLDKSVYRIYKYKAPVEIGTTTRIKKLFGVEPTWKQITKPQIYVETGELYRGAKVGVQESGKVSKVPLQLTKEQLPKLGFYGELTPKKTYSLISGKGKIIERIPEEALIVKEGTKTSKLILVPEQTKTVSNVAALSVKPAKLKVIARTGIEFPTGKEVAKIKRIDYTTGKTRIDITTKVEQVTAKLSEGPSGQIYRLGVKAPSTKVKGILMRIKEEVPQKIVNIKKITPSSSLVPSPRLEELAKKVSPITKVSGGKTLVQVTKQTPKTFPKLVKPVSKTAVAAKTTQIPKFVPKITSTTAVNLLSGVSQVIKPREKIVPKVKLIQITKQMEEIKQIPGQTPTQIPSQKTTPDQIPKLVPKLIPRLITEPILTPVITPRITPRTPPPRVPRIPITPIVPKLPERDVLTEKLKKLQEAGKSVDIVVGMERKKTRVLEKNLPPFKALKKASEYVDRNIEASFRLKVNPRKPKEQDIGKYNTNYKFRPSKRDPLYVVEKKKYRLDSPGETKQIKKSKLKTMKFI